VPAGREAGKPIPAWPTGLPLSIGTLFIVLLLLVMPANGWAYRPFISTDAAVADPHEVEIEFGYFTLDHDQGENTFTIPSLVLNYGLRRDIEVVGELRLERAAMGDIDLVNPALSLKQPSAIPDSLTGALAAGTVVAMGLWHLSPLPLMAGGAAIGLVLRAQWS
jgi:hypothetical protein